MCSSSLKTPEPGELSLWPKSLFILSFIGFSVHGCNHFQKLINGFVIAAAPQGGQLLPGALGRLRGTELSGTMPTVRLGSWADVPLFP